MCAVVGLSLATSATAGDWDRFRGPNGSGVSRGRSGSHHDHFHGNDPGRHDDRLADAYGDIQDIVNVVPFGRLLRNLHRWSAHAMVLLVIAHMARVFHAGAAREFLHGSG